MIYKRTAGGTPPVVMGLWRNGIRSGLKIRRTFVLVGSTPTSPTVGLRIIIQIAVKCLLVGENLTKPIIRTVAQW